MDSSAAGSEGQNVNRGVISKCAHRISDGNQDFIRDWITSHSQAKNLATFCPWPEPSDGRLSLKVLDKLEAKEKQPSSLLLKIDHLLFVFYYSLRFSYNVPWSCSLPIPPLNHSILLPPNLCLLLSFIKSYIEPSALYIYVCVCMCMGEHSLKCA